MKYSEKAQQLASLDERLLLIRQNYLSGIVGFFFAEVTTSVALAHEIQNTSFLLWIVSGFVLCFLSALLNSYQTQSRKRGGQPHVRREIILQATLFLLFGLHWAYLPTFYMDLSNLTVVIILSVSTCAVAVASILMLSPIIWVSLAFLIPSLLSLACAFWQSESQAIEMLGMATLAYLLALIWFSRNFEKTSIRTISLSIDNESLINRLSDSLKETAKANRSKSVFLAAASHDLRQPLHAIGLFVESLQGTELNAHQHRVTSHLSSAVGATRDMLNSLLDFSKLEAGAIKATRSSFLVQELFIKLEAEFAQTADDKHLIYRTRETTAIAYADPVLVELVLRNLISNAIRYTKFGGVLVACRRVTRQKLSIEVWDTGVGVGQHELDAIFQEFYQLDNSERDRNKGFGLGLANAQGVAKELGSQIEVRSNLDKGSVFKLLIPASTEALIEDLNEDNEGETNFAGKRVLLIDDDDVIRVAMRELLMSWGCICLIHESLEASWPHIDHSIDLLITDYRLRDGVTGKAVILAVRQQLQNELPAIILTGDTAANRIAEARSVNALLIHKPASAAKLSRQMAQLFSQK